MATLQDAERQLRELFGFARFRPAQQPVIASVLAGRDTLAILPTGGGKSVCFQVPAAALGGLTVVVSPLISLMQDQVAAARGRGIPAAALNSALDADARAAVLRGAYDGTLRLLYVSPERLRTLAPALAARGVRPRLLVVDEAHCIAEWGHDFRPSYRDIAGARRTLGGPQCIALTGSATPAVRADIVGALELGGSRGPCAVHIGSFDRGNLWFGGVRVRDEPARLQALLDLLAADDRMAIVYAPTRNTTEGIARVLRQAGHRAIPYHAGLDRERRRGALEAFLDDRVDVVVATCAFGMGIDKPTVRLVVHWTMPPTPESYYQEAGRAGRDGRFARCMLLWRPGDAELHRRQLDVTFPDRRLVERLWRDPSARRGVAANVLASADRLRAELRPDSGPVDWGPVRRRRRLAEDRIRTVEAYAGGGGCRRRRLIEYFGEALTRCAGCDRCTRRPIRSVGPAVGSRCLGPPGPPGSLPAALAAWRSRAASALAIAPHQVMSDGTLAAIDRERPRDRAALARIPGIGPRALAKHADAILSIVRAAGDVEVALPQ